ncbi:hypothetical protein SEA_HONK_60 [Microbacterium phage Honk]|uniref:Uncharacterized protein n=1 Tax=Microbacterium phage Honk TaxID=2836095 RepID=A0A8F3E8D2_9CAUD|nr:hypothetical protein SEA_HONK_60 [Microbacterium phage Honk]
MTTKTPIDRDRVNALMRAFRYGEKVDDLGKVDARHNSGQYDDITWHVALDGATCAGGASFYRAALIEALEGGATEKEAEDTAYHATAEHLGLTH